MTVDRRTREMDAKGYWRQFRTAFYFDRPGDQIAGVVLALEEEGPAKDPIPRLVLQADGKIRVVLASQERLKVALQDAEPVVGDQLTIVYTGDADKAAQGMTRAKLFTVEVRRPGSQPGTGTESTRGSASENGPRAGSKAT